MENLSSEEETKFIEKEIFSSSCSTQDNSDAVECQKRKFSYIFDDDFYKAPAPVKKEAPKEIKIDNVLPDIDNLFDFEFQQENQFSNTEAYKFEETIPDECCQTGMFADEFQPLLPVNKLYANLNEIACENYFNSV